MYGIKYISTTDYFNIDKEKQEQCIRNAQESWNTQEVRNSLKRSRKKAKIVLKIVKYI